MLDDKRELSDSVVMSHHSCNIDIIQSLYKSVVRYVSLVDVVAWHI